MNTSTYSSNKFHVTNYRKSSSQPIEQGMQPIDIKIYGTGTSSQMYIEHLMKVSLNASGIEHKIEHINDISQFIEKNINSIPAISIDGKITLEINQSEDYHSSIRKLIQKILKTKNYGKMKRILVPTDFSDCSNNAFSYAVQMANYMNAYIKVINAYYPSYTEVEGIPYMNESEISKRKEILDQFVNSNNKDFIGEVLSTPMIEGEAITGFPAESIKDMSSDYDLIIMGAHGERDVEKKIFGSVSISVALHADTNVIIVPEKSGFSPIKKITLALPFEKLNEKCINQFVDFANIFGADVDIIHILERPDSIQEDQNFLSISEKLQGSCDLKYLYGQDFAETINEYVGNNKSDMVCLVRKHKNFIQNIFTKSYTKEMVIKTEVPFMVIHERNS